MGSPSEMSSSRSTVQKQIRRAFLITLAVVFLTVIAYYTRIFETWENQVQDVLFRKFNPEHHPKEAVIVAIDQNSLNYFQQQGILWPWPRELYGILTEYLDACGAKAIVFDIIFDAPDIDRLNSAAEYSDSLFAGQMERSGKVILALQMQDSTTKTVGFSIERFKIPFNIAVDEKYIRSYPSVTAPIPRFQRSMAQGGAVNFFTDHDGICRRLPLLFKYGDRIIPYMALSAALLYLGEDSVGFKPSQQALVIGDRSIPVDDRGAFRVYWYGKAGPGGVFQYVAFAQVIQDYVRRLNGLEPLVPAEVFKDKVVFIGATAAGLLDLKTTPMSTLAPYPGVEIYATLFSNLIHRDFTREVPSWLWLLLIGVVILGLVYCWQRASVWVAGPVNFIMLLVPLISAVLVFREYKCFFPTITIEISLILAAIGVLSVNYLTEGKEKRLIKKVFNRYLHPAVVESLTKNPEKLEMGGKEIVATVMFTDLQGFTGISELFTPSEIVQFLNQYFEKVAQIVFENNGMLDKYTGDGIMAIFGAPIESPDHAHMACAAALGFKKLSALTIKAKNHDIPLITRIGINSGNFVVGNIGSSNRMDYTAIGDTVNLSARLEGVNKIYGTQNIISETTYELVKEQFLCRPLDFIRVKGRDKPLMIFSVMGRTDETDDTARRLLELHLQALELYRRGDYKSAQAAFAILQKEFPTDPVAKVFHQRCEQLAINPHLIDDEGVFNITVK